MESWKKPKPYIGAVVENSEVPFERLAYASSDVFFGRDSVIIYGFTEFIPEIVKKMDKKREFNSSDIFPKGKRDIVVDVLEAFFKNSKIIEDLGNGRYRAKQTVHVERGWFADSSKASVKACDAKSNTCR
jgi:hypothetical protein